MNSYTAQGIDVLTTSGNHEEESTYGGAWYGSAGYRARLMAALPSRVSSKCSGSYGERYECSYGASDAHHVVLLGWKQMASISESASSAAFVQSSFNAKPGAKWRHCVFHKPEGLLNPGDQHTSTFGNYDIYEACRRAGAVITSGHSHVYSRTKLVELFSASGQVVAGDDAVNPAVRCGATVSFVLGSSGYKHDGNGPNAGKSWFRKVFTRSDVNGDRAGALICDFGSDAASTSAQCEYRLASVNTVVDSFTLASSLCRPPTTQPPATQPPATQPPTTQPPTKGAPTTSTTTATPTSASVSCPARAASKGASVQLLSSPSYGNSGDSPQSEVSGLAVSSQTVNGQQVVWVVSDSGSKAQVVAFGVKTRERLARLDFSGSLKSGGGNDYEDLALGPCSGDAGAPTCIFVGEIGNNAARDAAGQSGRVVSNIYRIVEPVLPSSIDVRSPVMRSVPADVISFKFSQTGIVAADCEALMVDTNGDIYLTTKWNAAQQSLTRVFRIPAGAGVGTTLTLSPLSSANSALRSNTFTRGDISKTGKHVVLGSGTTYYVWTRRSTQTIEQALNSAPCYSASSASSAQHEAIAFGAGSLELWEIAEGSDPTLFKTTLATSAGLEGEADEVASSGSSADDLDLAAVLGSGAAAAAAAAVVVLAVARRRRAQAMANAVANPAYAGAQP